MKPPKEIARQVDVAAAAERAGAAAPAGLRVRVRDWFAVVGAALVDGVRGWGMLPQVAPFAVAGGASHFARHETPSGRLAFPRPARFVSWSWRRPFEAAAESDEAATGQDAAVGHAPVGAPPAPDAGTAYVPAPSDARSRDELIHLLIERIDGVLKTGSRRVVVDLSSVQRIDTALIAALVVLIRRARLSHARMEVVGAPSRLLHLLEIYRLADPLRHAGVLHETQTRTRTATMTAPPPATPPTVTATAGQACP